MARDDCPAHIATEAVTDWASVPWPIGVASPTASSAVRRASTLRPWAARVRAMVVAAWISP